MILFLLLVIAILLVMLVRSQTRKRSPDTKLSTLITPEIKVTFSYDDNNSFNDGGDLYSLRDDSSSEQNDAYEYIELSGQEYRLSLELELDYLDRAGRETIRTVQLRRFTLSSDKRNALLSAYCLLRKANRNFFASRIQRCVDLATGEVIQDIPSFLESRYAASPAGQLDALWDARADELLALLYVARLDGVLKQKKKDVIADFILGLEPSLNLAQKDVSDSLKDGDKISRTKFGRILNQLSLRDETYKSGLVQCAEMILQTKKTLRPDEGVVIEEMAKRLFPKRPRDKKAELGKVSPDSAAPQGPRLPPPPPPPPPGLQ